MKGKEKSLLDRFKPFWETGIKLSETERKIGFCVKNYAVTQIFTEFKKNATALKENDKKVFEGMVKELAVEKKTIGPDAVCSVEEYLEFLKNSFENIDDEDRNGEVNMQTSYNFRLLGDLIDVLLQWGPIPDEWVKKKKYSKFKAVDIFKSLKQGVTPKRGGPKEAEDELSKELNNMVIENKDNTNEKNQASKVTDIPGLGSNIDINAIDSNIIPSGSVESKNNDNNYHINIDMANTDIPMQNVRDHTNSMNKNDFDRNLQTKSLDKEVKRENTPNKQDLNNKTNINNKITPSTGNVKTVNINKFDIDKNSTDTSDSLDLKKNVKSSLLAADFKIDQKISRKMDFSFPVKFRTLEYFRLVDTINKILETGQRELDSNKVDKSLAQLELVLYYLHNIEK